MRKATKTIISFAVVLIAGLNFILPAFAQDPFTAIAVGGLSGASGAGLFSSMAGASGINIDWTNQTADEIDAMWNVLNPDHVLFSGEKHEATNVGEDVYDYITVDITDWLQAQTDFIKNFETVYQVSDNDSGTTESITSFRGIPFEVDNNSKSVSLDSTVNRIQANSSYSLINGPFRVDFSVGSMSWGSYKGAGTFYYLQNAVGSFSNSNFYDDIYHLRIGYLSNDPAHIRIFLTQGTATTGYSSNPIDDTPSANDTDWTSDTVDTDVFNGWESAKVKIPSSISQLSTGWTLTEFLNELDRIWTGAGEDNIIIEDGAQPVPPQPIPDTPLGDVPFDDWVDLWGQGIYQQLENQSDALDLIGSNGIDAIEELESIDTNTEDLVETAESIDTNIGIGNGILGGIRSLAQSAVNYLEGIAEHVGELVEEIVEGTETLIAGILNQIPQVFSVIFGPIKQASSIWHYVVEWIQSIGAPFQFIWSMASGTSYYIILPVYASLAAAVVLAFYKRFGK